jgi:hypothetical protein
MSARAVGLFPRGCLFTRGSRERGGNREGSAEAGSFELEWKRVASVGGSKFLVLRMLYRLAGMTRWRSILRVGTFNVDSWMA